MNRIYKRKTTPKVRSGKVAKKNNHNLTSLEGYIVDRERPEKGFKHVIKKKEIHDFIDIIPGWSEFSDGIHYIVLDTGGDNFDGIYRHFDFDKTGSIWLSAWPEELWIDCDDEYFKEHKCHFDMIGIVYEQNDDEWICHFTESGAKAFMLMHIFLHELGHHVDKLRSRNQDMMVGGEDFAEKFANTMFNKVWPLYIKKFGQP